MCFVISWRSKNIFGAIKNPRGKRLYLDRYCQRIIACRGRSDGFVNSVVTGLGNCRRGDRTRSCDDLHSFRSWTRLDRAARSNWFRKERKFRLDRLDGDGAGYPQAESCQICHLRANSRALSFFSSDRERPMAVRRCPGVERGWFDSPCGDSSCLI